MNWRDNFPIPGNTETTPSDFVARAQSKYQISIRSGFVTHSRNPQPLETDVTKYQKTRGDEPPRMVTRLETPGIILDAPPPMQPAVEVLLFQQEAGCPVGVSEFNPQSPSTLDTVKRPLADTHSEPLPISLDIPRLQILRQRQSDIEAPVLLPPVTVKRNDNNFTPREFTPTVCSVEVLAQTLIPMPSPVITNLREIDCPVEVEVSFEPFPQPTLDDCRFVNQPSYDWKYLTSSFFSEISHRIEVEAPVQPKFDPTRADPLKDIRLGRGRRQVVEPLSPNLELVAPERLVLEEDCLDTGPLEDIITEYPVVLDGSTEDIITEYPVVLDGSTEVESVSCSSPELIASVSETKLSAALNSFLGDIFLEPCSIFAGGDCLPMLLDVPESGFLEFELTDRGVIVMRDIEAHFKTGSATGVIRAARWLQSEPDQDIHEAIWGTLQQERWIYDGDILCSGNLRVLTSTGKIQIERSSQSRSNTRETLMLEQLILWITRERSQSWSFLIVAHVSNMAAMDHEGGKIPIHDMTITDTGEVNLNGWVDDGPVGLIVATVKDLERLGQLSTNASRMTLAQNKELGPLLIYATFLCQGRAEQLKARFRLSINEPISGKPVIYNWSGRNLPLSIELIPVKSGPRLMAIRKNIYDRFLIEIRDPQILEALLYRTVCVELDPTEDVMMALPALRSLMNDSDVDGVILGGDLAVVRSVTFIVSPKFRCGYFEFGPRVVSIVIATCCERCVRRLSSIQGVIAADSWGQLAIKLSSLISIPSDDWRAQVEAALLAGDDRSSSQTPPEREAKSGDPDSYIDPWVGEAKSGDPVSYIDPWVGEAKSAGLVSCIDHWVGEAKSADPVSCIDPWVGDRQFVRKESHATVHSATRIRRFQMAPERQRLLATNLKPGGPSGSRMNRSSRKLTVAAKGRVGGSSSRLMKRSSLTLVNDGGGQTKLRFKD